jgi:hypothetical protein
MVPSEFVIDGPCQEMFRVKYVPKESVGPPLPVPS